MASGTAATPAPAGRHPPPSERQRAHDAFQGRMEDRDQRTRRDGWPMQKVLVGLAVCTLALGMAVLAIVTKLDVNGAEDVPPSLAMATDGEEGEAMVLHAEPGLRWSDLQLDGDCAPLLNGAPLADTPNAKVLAGDTLACAGGDTLQIQSARDRGNAVLYRSTFPEDAPAPA